MDYSLDQTVSVQIGKPLMQCTPFALVVARAQKGEICDFCLKALSDSSFKITCTHCDYNFYCSDVCAGKDRSLHQNECYARIDENIEKYLGTDDFMNKIPKVFLSLDDMIEYTRLFFRVLQCSKIPMETDHSPFNAVFENFKQQIFWNDLPSELDLSEEQDDQDETIAYYMKNYDEMTEIERIEQDSKLGYKIPSDDFFKDIIALNSAKIVLDNLIDRVTECDFKSEVLDDFMTAGGNFVAIDSKNSQTTNTTTTTQENSGFANLNKNGSDEELFERFLTDLKDNNMWQQVSSLSYEKKMNLMNNCFESFKLDFGSNNGENIFKDSQAFFKKNIEELNEDSQLQSLKVMFRMLKLDMISSESSNKEDKPMDSQFGFWISRIKQILELDSVRKGFGCYEWHEIVKAFEVTLRFAISIPDLIYNWPIARAIFLPMTLVSHSCVPNTSAVFEGSTLRLFYLPRKELEVKSGKSYFQNVFYDQSNQLIYDPKLASSASPPAIFSYLPLSSDIGLDGLSFDFHYDLFSKVDSINLYILNKIRLIECFCEKCAQIKLIDLEKSNQEQNNRPIDDPISMFDDYQSWQIDDDDDNQEEYGNCLNIVEELNAQYGNYRDHEYSLKIQVPVSELINRYRQLLGYYHPKISILLLFHSYSNLFLLNHQKENHMIFYRYKFFHRQLLQTMDAFAITHGFNHRFLDVFHSLHSFVHAQLALFFNMSKDTIKKIEQFKSFSSAGWSANLFSEMTNCPKLKRLRSNVTEICNNDLVQKDGSTIKNSDIQSNINEDYAFNPFSKKRPFPYEDEVQDTSFQYEGPDEQVEGENAAGHFANVQNDMSKMFSLMSQVCDFSEFRKL